MNYQQAIDYLKSFPDSERGTTKTPTMSLDTVRSLLQKLGNPQDTVPAIHITGSKGKGSTATFIAAILKTLGYKTALYTSPHLHSPRERLAFDLEPISELEFARGLRAVRELVDEEIKAGGGPFSTFGLLTVLYFHLLKRTTPAIDWQIVEVGLGGTDDATNVFDHKDAAVITAISLEHTQILGQTIPQIVTHKAGIITPGCITVLAPQRDFTVPKMVREHCRQLKSEFVNVSDKYTFTSLDQSLEGQTFNLKGLGKSEIFSLKMLGDHQVENALTALATIHALERNGLQFPSKTIAEGLAAAKLPGRFEILSLSKNDKQEQEIILDGAHNQDSANALAKTITSLFAGRNLILVLAVNSDKNVEAIGQSFKGRAKQLIATKSNNPRSLPPAEIIERLTTIDPDQQYVLARDIGEALDTALSLANNDDLICITGSLYIVAEARERILKRQKIAVS